MSYVSCINMCVMPVLRYLQSFLDVKQIVELSHKRFDYLNNLDSLADPPQGSRDFQTSHDAVCKESNTIPREPTDDGHTYQHLGDTQQSLPSPYQPLSIFAQEHTSNVLYDNV